MPQSFVLEYWNDEGWFVGRLRGIPGVFSQGETLEELEENIRDAYQLMTIDEEPAPTEAKTKELVFDT
ncbi:MAG: type II toxin-antitoxin system HicB family antitoxin [Cyanothece sp. SIO2G6]|nr:type II toxin-antitoxin system HicB family antitoxin [Cyanothece sp. SIO2G6]